MLIGVTRLRVNSEVVFLGAAVGLRKKGPGNYQGRGYALLVFNGVNTFIKWLKKFDFTCHALQEGI